MTLFTRSKDPAAQAAQAKYLLYYVFSCPPIVFAAAGTLTANVNIDGSADFRANYMTIGVTQANLVVVNWGGTIQIDETGKGRTLFDRPQLVDMFRGIGQLPYRFEPPRLFRRNSTVVITLVNPVATATTIQVAFHGHKLMDSEAPA
jgi:hypothetical protein